MADAFDDALAPVIAKTAELARLHAPYWPMVYHGTVDAYFHAVTNVRAEVLDIETDHVLYRGPKSG